MRFVPSRYTLLATNTTVADTEGYSERFAMLAFQPPFRTPICHRGNPMLVAYASFSQGIPSCYAGHQGRVQSFVACFAGVTYSGQSRQAACTLLNAIAVCVQAVQASPWLQT